MAELNKLREKTNKLFAGKTESLEMEKYELEKKISRKGGGYEGGNSTSKNSGNECA